MAVNRKAAMTRRERERARQQRQKDKAERRLQRREEKRNRTGSDDGVDPDIAHIVPGPQQQMLDGSPVDVDLDDDEVDEDEPEEGEPK